MSAPLCAATAISSNHGMKKAGKQPLAFFRHISSPVWGTAVLVREHYDQRTYLFTDGQARVFKTAIASKFIEASEPPSAEDQARLERGIAALDAAHVATLASPDTPKINTLNKATATPKAINFELEAEIRAVAAQSDEPYLVYADWLQARDDPRGQLIVTQQQLNADPDNKKLRGTEKALFRDHGTYFLPPRLAHMLATRRKTDPGATATELVWHCGFIDRIQVARRSPRQPELGPILTELLAHPSAQFARSITLGALGKSDGYSYVSLLELIRRARPPLLEELVIGNFDSDQMDLEFSTAGELSPLINALPNLQRLVVHAGSARFGSRLKHANLRELSFATAGITQVNLDKLVKLAMPKLEVFELEVPELALTGLQLASLLGNPSFANLRRLALRRTTNTTNIFEGLTRAPFLPQLRELDLAHGDLTDSAMLQIVQHAPKLAKLVTLSLDGNRISEPRLARIAEACAAVQPTGQHANRFAITDAQVAQRAPDARSMSAARKVAHVAGWITLGRDGDRVWGEYEGGDHYWVMANVFDEADHGCNCPSPKQPCKHALGLLLLAAAQHAFSERPMPDTMRRHATLERPRYALVWE